MTNYTTGELLYDNPLASEKDIEGFIAEGEPVISFPKGAMRLENGMDPELGQAANFLFWCPEVFPANITATWEFMPIKEPGLAMFWMGANGQDGKDLFDPSLAKREGNYRSYHSSDINAYHGSYFRRKQDNERRFHTCNLRKSCGFHLVTQGGDPIPSIPDVDGFYTITMSKFEGRIQFSVDDLLCYDWQDDGETYGPLIGEGYIGFRQMAPLIAEYKNLKIHALNAC